MPFMCAATVMIHFPERADSFFQGAQHKWHGQWHGRGTVSGTVCAAGCSLANLCFFWIFRISDDFLGIQRIPAPNFVPPPL